MEVKVLNIIALRPKIVSIKNPDNILIRDIWKLDFRRTSLECLVEFTEELMCYDVVVKGLK